MVVWLCARCATLKKVENPPCVDSKRLRDSIQNVPVCTGNKSKCSTHSDLLLVHTVTF